MSVNETPRKSAIFGLLAWKTAFKDTNDIASHVQTRFARHRSAWGFRP